MADDNKNNLPVSKNGLLEKFKSFSRSKKPLFGAISSISAIGSILILGIPKISISPSINPDPGSIFGTRFSIKNEGHIPVYIDDFQCAVTVEHEVFPKNNTKTNLAVKRWVSAGTTITRQCEAQYTYTAKEFNADVKVNYKLIPYLINWDKTVYFIGISGKSGYFLVPDVK